MIHTTAVIIGGGATGVGILRDLAMRGVPALLLEQGNLAHGTSSRFHGLLHSGARYAVQDTHSARECAEENAVLRRVARHCIEGGEGLFVRTPQDDPAFVEPWRTACAAAGISAEPLSAAEARRLEPRLAPDIEEAYRVPDACIDGFRLVQHNAQSARRGGGKIFIRHTVAGIEHSGGRITGVRAVNAANGEEVRIACDICINASGAWAGLVARLAGLEVRVSPDRGSLIVFNHRFASRVINRLHPGADGDIFVPHGSVTIFGTTSTPTDRPDNTTPTTEETLRLLELGRLLFPDIEHYRILRVFAGTRPLYAPGAGGRAAGRGFHIVDHGEEGLSGMFSIFGGKLTTYRLMAEKVCDLAAVALGVHAPCRTAEEPLVSEPSPDIMKKARRCFPAHGVQLVADRLGDDFAPVVEAACEETGAGAELICECELVSRAEVEHAAREESTLSAVRLRTRLGMGTCQGTFCSLRATALLTEQGIFSSSPPLTVRSFLQERWKGLRPALWGSQLKEAELGRAIYAATLNIDTFAREDAATAPRDKAAFAEPAPAKTGAPEEWKK